MLVKTLGAALVVAACGCGDRVSTDACVDEQGAPTQCGGCGLACEGTCTGGRCIVTLASGHPQAWSLAVDATSVYWFDEPVDYVGALMKCAKTGCNDEHTALATEQASPRSIAVDAASVYWVNEGNPLSNIGEVMRCDVGGCAGTPEVLASGQAAPYSVAVDAAFVYWANSGTESIAPTIARCGLDGCGVSPTVLASGKPDWGQSLAVDSTSFYWMDDISLAQCPKAGCNGAPLTLETGAAPAEIVAVDGLVSWTEGDGVKSCASGGGSAPTTLSSSSWPQGIAQDDAYVYWTEIDDKYVGRVMKCAISGCGGVPTVLAAGLGNTAGIAVDQTSVYWIEYGIDNGVVNPAWEGTVMKLTPK
jgi:hypothetical protein